MCITQIQQTPTGLFLHYSNLQTVALIDAYCTISMTTTSFHDDHILFEQQQKALGTFLLITSSLLKLVNGSTHGDETWYACVLHHFHDKNMFVNNNKHNFFIGGLPPFTEIYVVVYKNE